MSKTFQPWALSNQALGAVSRNSRLQRGSKRRFLLKLKLAEGLCDVGRMLRRGLPCLRVVRGGRWRQAFIAAVVTRFASCVTSSPASGEQSLSRNLLLCVQRFCQQQPGKTVSRSWCFHCSLLNSAGCSPRP